MNDNRTIVFKIGVKDIILITLVFTIQKFFGVIDWSWWWVFSPIWIFYLFILSLAVILGLYDAYKGVTDERF